MLEECEAHGFVTELEEAPRRATLSDPSLTQALKPHPDPHRGSLNMYINRIEQALCVRMYIDTEEMGPGDVFTFNSLVGVSKITLGRPIDQQEK